MQQVLDEKEDVTHEVADDLESFFYVFIWICAIHNGPGNGAACSEPKPFVYQWGLTHGIDFSRYMKRSFVGPPIQTIAKRFAPYFQNLEPLAEEWRNPVRAEGEHRNKSDCSVPLASFSRTPKGH